jgi:hypothetical protein
MSAATGALLRPAPARPARSMAESGEQALRAMPPITANPLLGNGGILLTRTPQKHHRNPEAGATGNSRSKLRGASGGAGASWTDSWTSRSHVKLYYSIKMGCVILRARTPRGTPPATARRERPAARSLAAANSRLQRNENFFRRILALFGRPSRFV